MGCNCFKKSSIEGYSTSPQTLATGQIIEYASFKQTGESLNEVGSTGIKIEKSGLYYISFDASAVESGTAGNVTVQLLQDGVPVPYAVATSYSSGVTDVVNLGFSTVIEVLGSCGCVVNRPTFTVENSGVDATYSIADLIVVKLA